MSSGPRVVFLRFGSADSPKLRPWKDHGRRVLGAPPAVAAPATAVIWHLSSANNRMLGRSAGIFADVPGATASLRAQIEGFASWKIRFVGDEIRGNYGWYAVAEQEPVMVCARWYTTERDRRHAVDLAMSSIVVADVLPGSRLIGGRFG